MRILIATLILLLSLPAVAQDLDALFRNGMKSVEEAFVETDEDRRDALLDEAIGAFHAMLVERPELVRVRLELARAFFLKREDGLAREHFETVLAGDVPEEVKANVQIFLAKIRARRRWSFNLGVAVAPDSNISGGSDERIIYIYGLPFERDTEELTTSGIGLSVWGGAEYQAPISDRLRVRAGAQASRREYERSVFDQHFVALHLGPRWLLDAATDVSLLASARQQWSGTTPNYRDVGGRLEFSHRLGLPSHDNFA
ncbi:MAG: surface lipoprotein assembly modifier [bacterium]|nr:surface lipoprotein assembly modifier [bacterium]